ncbi:MAG TPA: AAA family ATPase [Thermodesulfobacteriota bacterium]|jgi:chromosome partitioning protein|nr:AAA family ATPase [Thermodesulfobacteriota bacterium]
MRAKSICIANQKGGVGKTTTAVNLAASLSTLNKKTLLIDIDPQGNAASGLGIKREEIKENIYHFLIADLPLQNLVHQTALPFLEVIPSTLDLIGAEIELVSIPSREYRLREGLKKIEEGYDYIIIDCPPSLGLLTINSLTAADTVLIPIQCEYYALEGLSQLLATIRLVKKNLNPDLRIEGILLTMFDRRNNLSHQVAADIKNNLAGKVNVYGVIIPRSVRLAECPSFGKPILLYDENSPGARCYLELAHIINKGDGFNEKDSIR